MLCEARLVFRYPDARRAQEVHGAIQADDDLQCETRVQGSEVQALLGGDSPRSLLRAVDDLLGCVAVAEDVINAPALGREDAGH